MSEVRWYRLAYLLPIIVPALAAGTWVVLVETAWLPGAPLSGAKPVPASLLLTFFFSGLLGGIPYALFVAVVLICLWSRPARTYRRVALIMPLLFVPILLLWCCFAVPWLGPDEPARLSTTNLHALSPLAAPALGVGYFYVFIALAVGRWLRQER
jgi:hypothetical protein